MQPQIRRCRLEDIETLYAISLATGFRGQDASNLYSDRDLMGHIYVGPYVTMAPELCLVVEDEVGVGGFVAGTPDTVAWAEKLEREWWPSLRRKYADPADTPAERRTANQRRAFMIHHPELPPAEVTERFPAHMHLNLLPRLQRRGLGSALLGTWVELGAVKGANGIHVGVNRENKGGRVFWSRQGFADISLPDNTVARTVWMGRFVSDSETRC